MTLQQFQNMEPDSRQEIMNEQAVYLCTIAEAAGEFTLFQLENFYVEVFCSSKYDEDSLIICFEDTELLEPYFKKISLAPVYDILGNYR